MNDESYSGEYLIPLGKVCPSILYREPFEKAVSSTVVDVVLGMNSTLEHLESEELKLESSLCDRMLTLRQIVTHVCC